MDTSNSCAAATFGTTLLVSMLAAAAGIAQGGLSTSQDWSNHAANFAEQSSMRACSTLAANLVDCAIPLACLVWPQPRPSTATVMSSKLLYAV